MVDVFVGDFPAVMSGHLPEFSELTLSILSFGTYSAINGDSFQVCARLNDNFDYTFNDRYPYGHI